MHWLVPTLIVPLVIIIVGFLAIVLIARYQKYTLSQTFDLLGNRLETVLEEESPIEAEDDFDGVPYVKNAVDAALDASSVDYALFKWCTGNGHQWLNKLKVCTVKEEACKKESNPDWAIGDIKVKGAKPWLRFSTLR